jgi:hypothetical protein
MSNTPFYSLDELLALKAQGSLKQTVVENRTGDAVRTSQFRDVHQYDGKLYIPEPQECQKYTDDQKKILLKKFLDLLENPYSKHMSIKIICDCSSDPANNISPSDLLADILARKMSIDIFFLLEEQLSDNFCLGQCLQGRTNRLVQIRNMLF